MSDDAPVSSALRTQRAVTALAEADPQFRELTTMLFGASDPEVVFAKLSPDSSSVHVPSTESPGQPRGRKWALRLGLAGAYAGGALALKEGGEGAAKLAGREVSARNAVRTRSVRGIAPRAHTVNRKTRAVGGGKLAFAGFAGGADAVAARLASKAQKQDQVAKAAGLDELASGALTQSRRLVAHILGGGGEMALRGADALGDTARTAKQTKVPLAKNKKTKATPAAAAATGVAPGTAQTADQLAMFGAGGAPATPGTTARGVGQQQVGAKIGGAIGAATSTPARAAATAGGVLGVGAVAANSAGKAGGQQNQLGYDTGPVYYSKRDEDADIEISGTFAKFDTDKRLAFGWANVCKIDGEVLVDRQGDIVVPEDLEDAVYAYNKTSRRGGDMHLRTDGIEIYDQQFEKPGDTVVHVGDLVESMVFTAEKKAALGLPESFPEGWWIGMQYHDDDVWDDIKSGRRSGFSVHGKGIRMPEVA